MEHYTSVDIISAKAAYDDGDMVFSPSGSRMLSPSDFLGRPEWLSAGNWRVKRQPKPGNGYRLLKPGEDIQEGDEFLTSSGTWMRSNSVGFIVGSAGARTKSYRRKLVCAVRLVPHEFKEDTEGKTLRADGWYVSGWINRTDFGGFDYSKLAGPEQIPGDWRYREEQILWRDNKGNLVDEGGEGRVPVRPHRVWQVVNAEPK